MYSEIYGTYYVFSTNITFNKLIKMQPLKRDNNKDYISPWKPLDSGQQIEDLLKNKVIEELIAPHQKIFMSSKKSINSKKRKLTLPVGRPVTEINIPRSSLKIFHKTMSDFRRNVLKNLSQTITTKTATDGPKMARMKQSEQFKLLDEIIFIKKYAPFVRKATIVTLGNQKSQVTQQTNLINNSTYFLDSPSKQYFKKCRKKRNKTSNYTPSKTSKTLTLTASKQEKNRVANKILTVWQLKQSFSPSVIFFPSSSKKISRCTTKTRI